MNRRIFYGLGAMVAGALTLAAVANGPYYALPAWAQKLVCATTSNCPRFIVLADWNSEAVLDRETGLVWERSPSISGFGTSWNEAVALCNNVAVGNRKGWRLPTIQELASLVDPSVSAPGPTLPNGHPFQAPAAVYWSATNSTLIVSESASAWGVSFGTGTVFARPQNADARPWCVRGGQGVEVQG